jgi:hypothetical protein
VQQHKAKAVEQTAVVVTAATVGGQISERGTRDGTAFADAAWPGRKLGAQVAQTIFQHESAHRHGI